jgi:hypothetical protein
MSIPLRKTKIVGLPKQGYHDAVISDVEDAGRIASPYDDPDAEPKPKIKISYRITDERRDDGEPHEFGELYTNSDYEGSKLVQHLRQLGLSEMPEDLEALAGTRCRVNVGHRVSAKGGTWPQVLGLAPATAEPSAPAPSVPVSSDVLDAGPAFSATKEDVPF